MTFSHGPAQRWNIADQHEVRYARTGSGDDFVRLGGCVNLSPLDLIAPNSLSVKMSNELGVLTTPAKTRVADRPAWTVDLGTDSARISLVFDDATGVITQLINRRIDVFPVEILALAEHAALPETTFAAPIA